MIISKQLGEWGAYTYDEKQDVARIDLKKEPLAEPVDEFTMSIDKDGNGGVLKLMWESTDIPCRSPSKNNAACPLCVRFSRAVFRGGPDLFAWPCSWRC